ncbi:WapI family immunity protein [Aeromonas hydrophila]
MKVGTNSEYIELESLEKNQKGGPCVGDIRVRVVLNLQAFSGAHNGIWFEFTEMNRFISDLKSLDETRVGSAKISSMSPDEFMLEIRPSDSLGHIEMEVQLHRYQYSGVKNWPVYLKGGFFIESEDIKKLISCFTEFTS